MTRQETLLRVILVVHFVLSAWAMQAEWLPLYYFFAQIALCMLYLWGIIQKESSEAILLAAIFTCITFIMDIVAVAVYYDRGQIFNPGPGRPLFLFCVAMASINIIFKLPCAFLLSRLYRERGGETPSALASLPGLPNWANQRSAYGDIDQPAQIPPTAKPDEYQAPGAYQVPPPYQGT